ncbi:hypothetical protein D3C80_1491820 [compost metagenome]
MYWLLICTGQLKLERGGQFDRFFHLSKRVPPNVVLVAFISQKINVQIICFGTLNGLNSAEYSIGKAHATRCIKC